MKPHHESRKFFQATSPCRIIHVFGRLSKGFLESTTVAYSEFRFASAYASLSPTMHASTRPARTGSAAMEYWPATAMNLALGKRGGIRCSSLDPPLTAIVTSGLLRSAAVWYLPASALRMTAKLPFDHRGPT